MLLTPVALIPQVHINHLLHASCRFPLINSYGHAGCARGAVRDLLTEDSREGLGRADLKPIPHLSGGELRIDPDSATRGRSGGQGAIQNDFVAEWRDPGNLGKRNRLCQGEEELGGQT